MQGADVAGLDETAAECAKAAQKADEIKQVMQLIVIALRAAQSFTGPWAEALIRVLTTTVIPWLDRIANALRLFATVLAKNAEAQRKVSEGYPIDTRALPTYPAPVLPPEPPPLPTDPTPAAAAAAVANPAFADRQDATRPAGGGGGGSTGGGGGGSPMFGGGGALGGPIPPSESAASPRADAAPIAAEPVAATTSRTGVGAGQFAALGGAALGGGLLGGVGAYAANRPKETDGSEQLRGTARPDPNLTEREASRTT